MDPVRWKELNDRSNSSFGQANPFLDMLFRAQEDIEIKDGERQAPLSKDAPGRTVVHALSKTHDKHGIAIHDPRLETELLAERLKRAEDDPTYDIKYYLDKFHRTILEKKLALKEVIYRLSIFSSGAKSFFVEERVVFVNDVRTLRQKRSDMYSTRERAMLAYTLKRIRWVESIS